MNIQFTIKKILSRMLYRGIGSLTSNIYLILLRKKLTVSPMTKKNIVFLLVASLYSTGSLAAPWFNKADKTLMSSLQLLVSGQLLSTNLNQERIYIAPIAEQLYQLEKGVLSNEERQAVDRLLNAIRHEESNFNQQILLEYTSSDNPWVPGEQAQFGNYSTRIGTEWYQGNFAAGFFVRRTFETIDPDYSKRNLAGSYLAYSFPRLSVSIAPENLYSGPGNSGLFSYNRFYAPPVTLQISNGRLPLLDGMTNHNWDLTVGQFDRHAAGKVRFAKAASHHIFQHSFQLSAELSAVKTEQPLIQWQQSDSLYGSLTFSANLSTSTMLYSRLDYQQAEAGIAYSLGIQRSQQFYGGLLQGFIEGRYLNEQFFDWQFIGANAVAQRLKADNSFGLNWFDRQGLSLRWQTSIQHWDDPIESRNTLQTSLSGALPVLSGLLTVTMKWQNSHPISVAKSSAADAGISWQLRF
jgi:hypothetical protein